MADEHKAKGNAAFSAGNYAEAVEHFTNAINVDATNHVFFSNRSAALSALNKYDEALKDAEQTVTMKPDWPKGYSRKGAALFGLKHLEEAVECYKKGLELDPENAQLKDGLADVERAMAAGSGANPMASIFGPELIGKLATNPQTSKFLGDPSFMRMIADCQQNPNNMNKYLKDPRMMMVLSVGLGVNVMGGDQAAAAFGGEGADAMDTASTPSAPEPAPAPRPAPKPASAPEPTPMEEEGPKADAKREKEKGNAAYKSKNFDVAIEHYNRAIALDPEDISFITNRAAVYFEKGDYAECVKDCDKAVEKGRELRVDYKLIGKAMTRKGNALKKQGNLEGAIDVYNKALMEHRNADTLKRLNDTEKELKDAKAKAYLDPEKAEEARQKGNELFKEQKFPEAVEQYTESIKRNPNDPKVYSNRAACYTKLTAFNEATKDAEKCIELDPTWAKGYTRKGHVEFFTKQYDKAIETYQEGLKHDPENEELKDGLRRCNEQIYKGSTGQLSEAEMKARQERAMADPEIQSIMSDPVMRQVLQDFSTDPKAAAEHQKNPMIMAKINKLIAAGIVQTR